MVTSFFHGSAQTQIYFQVLVRQRKGGGSFIQTRTHILKSLKLSNLSDYIHPPSRSSRRWSRRNNGCGTVTVKPFTSFLVLRLSGSLERACITSHLDLKIELHIQQLGSFQDISKQMKVLYKTQAHDVTKWVGRKSMGLKKTSLFISFWPSVDHDISWKSC